MLLDIIYVIFHRILVIVLFIWHSWWDACLRRKNEKNRWICCVFLNFSGFRRLTCVRYRSDEAMTQRWKSAFPIPFEILLFTSQLSMQQRQKEHQRCAQDGLFGSLSNSAFSSSSRTLDLIWDLFSAAEIDREMTFLHRWHQTLSCPHLQWSWYYINTPQLEVPMISCTQKLCVLVVLLPDSKVWGLEL